MIKIGSFESNEDSLVIKTSFPSTSSTSTPKFQNDSAMNKERTLEVTTELSINKKAEETKLIKEESILIPPTCKCYIQFFVQ